MTSSIDLFRYHDLTERLAAYSTDGGQHLRGDREDLSIQDAEPALHPGEVELGRVGGAVRLVGSRTVADSRDGPSLGLVLEAGATLVVTSVRLIVLATHGVSQLGATNDDEVHTFVFPWDLVDTIAMPARRSIGDRIAGNRTIEISCLSVIVSLQLTPAKQAEISGQRRAIKDDEVMDFLVRAAVAHRRTVSPPEDHRRLEVVEGGRYAVADGERTAWITDPDSSGLPLHLVSRILERRDAEE
jgi:hypothetical protein